MDDRLGAAGYAAAIHYLLSRWLADDLAAPWDERMAARLESVRGDLATLAGASPDPEADPAAGLAEAWCYALAAEVLVERADALAAPTLGSEGELVCDYQAVLDRLREAEEGEDDGDTYSEA